MLCTKCIGHSHIPPHILLENILLFVASTLLSKDLNEG